MVVTVVSLFLVAGAMAEALTYNSKDVTKTIPDPGTIYSSLTVPDSIIIKDVDVVITIKHQYNADLDVYLISPDGTEVELFTDVGDYSANFVNTILDDEADWAIGGTYGRKPFAPFSRRYQPEGNLSDFDGLAAQGEWKLKVTDDDDALIGTLQSWSLIIEEELPPIANFEGSPRRDSCPLTVQFTDKSERNITNWSWDFGDGETETYKQKQDTISHTYNDPGVYTVSLTVTGPGGSDTKTIPDYITAIPPTADFVGDPNSGCKPLTVQFTDKSEGRIDKWEWDFGDQGTSTQQNPSHTYQNPGVYTVSLTVTGPGRCGSDTKTMRDYITVVPPPAADFVGDPISDNNCAPLTVQFTDKSEGEIDKWEWDFGDGVTSTQQSPSHTYQHPGVYTVSLTVTGRCGSDTKTMRDYITVIPPPTADFVGDPNSGCKPLTVQFTDKSEGEITSWLWDFGDGGTSTLQNPTHTYNEYCPPLHCLDFEEPPMNSEYRVGDSFVDSGVTMSIEGFQWASGGWTNNGFARIDGSVMAGHQGQDINLNNVNLKFHFDRPVCHLTLHYGEYGGNLNLEINGQLRNFQDMPEMHGQTIAGVTVTVVDLGDRKGLLELHGEVLSLLIGGQELWIDHVCNGRCVYTVSLTVTGPCGSDTKTKPGYITMSSPPFPCIKICAIISLDTEVDPCDPNTLVKVLKINDIDVRHLILGTTTADFEKFPDHPAADADNFDLTKYASLDEANVVQTWFGVPVTTIFILERGADDSGFFQALDKDGNPICDPLPFTEADWGVWPTPAGDLLEIDGQPAGDIMVEAINVPIYGLQIFPPEDKPLGIDPASISAIQAAGLLAHWKFDGDAKDSSANAYHGTEHGDPEYVEGKFGQAIELDGDGDYIEHALPLPLQEGTLMHWLKPNQVRRMVAYYESSAEEDGWGNSDVLEIQSAIDGDNGQWYFCYQDGPKDTAKRTIKFTATRTIKSTVTEIQRVRKSVSPALASNPSPANGETCVPRDVTLSWKPGESAETHDVYLGTDRIAVENAVTFDMTGIYRGRQDPNSYTPPEGLEFGQTYYWRIDEVEADRVTIHTGDVWQFTVEDIAVAQAGVWTHMTVTWDRAGDLVMYIDGDEVGRKNLADQNFVSHASVYRQIGRPAKPFSGEQNLQWSGAIDDVRVYDRALTPDQIATVMAGGSL